MHWKLHKQSKAALVQTCLAAHGQNCQAWEHQIDTLVARLYGLSDAALNKGGGKAKNIN